MVQDPNYRRKYFRFAIGMMFFLGLAMGVYYLIQRGYYPAATVGSRIISARMLDEAAQSVVRYYEQAVKTYGSTDPALKELADKEISVREARRATLDKLIENELIARAAESAVGNELARLVETKVSAAKLNDPQFQQAVVALYGLNTERFREFVLEPQAREEILQSVKFSASVEEFKKWLTTARKSAKVIVLVPDLNWDGEKVTFR
mgnify:CR=1 FL=1